MDPLSMLVGAGLLVAGALVGLPVGVWRGRRGRQPKPFCPCEHAAPVHQDGTGPCNAQLKRTKYNALGKDVGSYYVRCPCTRYMGPEIITAGAWSPGVLVAEAHVAEQ
jgi:hypothetical protein